MSSLQDVITNMKDLGFTEYEARAYTAALQKGQPVTGYELSRLSGIPTSKIYETIDRLKDKGALWANLSDPVKYVAVNPKQLLRQCQQQFQQKIDFLDRNFADLLVEKGSDQIWNIHGYDNIVAKACDMLVSCQQRALVALWPEEAEHIKDALPGKARVVILSYGKLSTMNGAQVFVHDYEKEVRDEQNSRLFVVTSDGEQALIGAMHEEAHAAWTTNPSLVLIAQEYIKHEIYQVRIMAHYGDKFAEVFGNSLEHLRLGREPG